MATEEFKEVTRELLGNYLELREVMASKGFANISFSFKEYLDHYIEYNKEVYNDLAYSEIDDIDSYEDMEDDEDLESSN